MSRIVTFLLLASCLNLYGQLGTDVFTIASDIASNYGSSWSNGSNNGSGFGSWSLSTSGSGSAGHFIGATGEGNPSFGLFAEPFNSSAAERPLGTTLRRGETIKINLGHTATINTGAELLFQLIDNSSVVFTLKFVGGQANWLINDGGSDFSAGQAYSANNSIPFTFTYNEDGTYSYTFGTGSGNNFNATNNISSIDAIRLTNNGQGSGENFGFDDLVVESKYTIPNGSSTKYLVLLLYLT